MNKVSFQRLASQMLRTTLSVRAGARRPCSRLLSHFTHIDEDNRPTMVDVSHKSTSLREAHARSIVRLPDNIIASLLNAGPSSSSAFQPRTKKGPIFDTAIIAGVMASKRTSDLIPFCHPVPLDDCKITISFENDDDVRATPPAAAVGPSSVIVIDCRVKTTHRTGVEMEALVGASVAALTIYDMCKALSHDIVIESTMLMGKTGGKKDFKR